MRSIRPLVFWPPALMLIASVTAGLINFDGFLKFANSANNFILTNLDWAFTSIPFMAVLLAVIIAISPLGAVRIGGDKAVPILSRWNWFAITLCTTVAIGILFWGAAEPMFHVNQPPAFLNVAPGSIEAVHFALSSMFLHWTITPYAIYALPSLAFALSFYNFAKPYSLVGPLSVLTNLKTPDAGHGPEKIQKWTGDILDGLALMALVAGVAAALGTGVLTVVGGAEAILGLKDSLGLRFVITSLIVAAFIISSLSGLQRGIRWLSDINARIFIVMAVFILLAGPTREILLLTIDGLKHYVTNFIPASLALGERASDPWTLDWTVYFFANWLAWAPLTALFLGRIAVGYTVREFLLFNLVLPSLFSIFWMGAIGGAAIMINEGSAGALGAILTANGPEAVIYLLLKALPFFSVVGFVFLITVLISFVTAMDSNTLSISNLCMRSSSTDQKEQTFFGTEGAMKIFWGVLIGLISFIMTSTTGIDGVRLLSNLGGVPGLFILILSGAVLIKLLWGLIFGTAQKNKGRETALNR